MKTVIERPEGLADVVRMAREAGYDEISETIPSFQQFIERFAALVREDEREKFTAVGEVKDGAFGGFVWNEGITSDDAPDGAVLYVRSGK